MERFRRGAPSGIGEPYAPVVIAPSRTMSRRLHLLHALDAHRSALTARLDTSPEAAVHASPAPGAWSLAQVAEHLVLIDSGLRFDGRPAPPLVRATSAVRSAAIQGVLRLPLRIPAPPSAGPILPSTAPRWPEVRARWAALRAGWVALDDAEADRVAFRHPLAGPFLLDDALAFLLAHHRHHDAQVERTFGSVARFETLEPSRLA